MSSGRRQKRSKQVNPDVSEEGKQQELDLPDQPSSSWSDVGGAEEKSEAGPPRVSLAGATDDEQEIRATRRLGFRLFRERVIAFKRIIVAAARAEGVNRSEHTGVNPSEPHHE